MSDLNANELRLVRLGVEGIKANAAQMVKQMHDAKAKGDSRFDEEVLVYESRVSACDALLAKLPHTKEGQGDVDT